MWELDHIGIKPEVWAAHIAKRERRETFHDFEIMRLGLGGEIRYISVSGVAAFDANGRFTGYRGVGRDNTQMRQVGEALRASELQLRQITDAVPALIAYVDSDHYFRFHNRAYEEIFGLTHAQIDGKSLREVLDSAAYEIVRGRVDEVLSGYPVVYERTQKTARGDVRDYVVNYFPRYGEGDEEDKVIGFYSLAKDITELKNNEREKSRLLAAIQQEIRQPLTSMCQALALVRAKPDCCTDDESSFIAAAQADCQRLLVRMTEVLDIAGLPRSSKG
jgi:PAS domain S-box-containing protein